MSITPSNPDPKGAAGVRPFATVPLSKRGCLGRSARLRARPREMAWALRSVRFLRAFSMAEMAFSFFYQLSRASLNAAGFSPAAS